jgi:hypothetical protein
MKTDPSCVQYWLTLAALSTMLWLAAPAGAQTVHLNDSGTEDRDGGDLDGLRAAAASFDRFLDDHQEIAEQVRKNPSLLNDRHFVSTHPALQAYLWDHAGVTQQIAENPNAFMEQENRYDRHGDFDVRRGGDFDTRRPDDVDARRAALGEFDRHLEAHPQIAEQVRRDPSLLTNQEYLNNNPSLKAQIQDHPQVQQEITQNPNAFMQAEARHDQPGGGDFDARGGTDLDGRRAAVTNFDRFLDDHQEIAEQVRKNPSLLDNQQFVTTHPALQAYLQDHPTVTQQITSNPSVFMRQEDRYDQRDNGVDRDTMRRQRADFGEFLGRHSNISQQLANNPDLVKQKEYLASRPELQEYLSAHPDVQQALMQNPESFVRSAQQYGSNSPTVKTPSTQTTPSTPTTKTTVPKL